jgi:TonB family protein
MIGKVLFFLVLTVTGLSAQTQLPNLAALKKEFKDRVFYLRDFNQDNSFSITAEGASTDRPKMGSWTTSLIEVKDVEVKGFDVVISGNRLGLLRDSRTNKLVPFRTKKKLKVRVEGAHRSSAWRAYFISNSRDLWERVPAYYRGYLEGKFGGPKSPEAKKIPTDLTPPKVKSAPDPEYDELARQHAIQGVSVFRLVIDTEGRPTKIEVQRPIGMGLDDQAFAVLQKWSFEPARKNGEPAATQIQVEFSFRLHP